MASTLPKELTTPVATLVAESGYADEAAALTALADQHASTASIVQANPLLGSLADHHLQVVDIADQLAGLDPEVVELLTYQLDFKTGCDVIPAYRLMSAREVAECQLGTGQFVTRVTPPATHPSRLQRAIEALTLDEFRELNGITVVAADAAPEWLTALSADWEAVNEMTLADAAEWYASHGIPVFRQTRHKTPLSCEFEGVERGKGGHHLATTDVETVRRWWAERPDANIGTAAGKAFDVLDADHHPEKGEYGVQMVRERLQPAGLLVGACAVAVTPSGGRHYLFAPDASHRAEVGGTKYGFPIDLRAEGGAATLPPSRNADGVRYQWAFVNAANWGPTIQWDTIVALLRTRAPRTPVPYSGPKAGTGKTNIEGLRKWLRGLSDGRQMAVYSVAMTLLNEGHDPDVLIDDITAMYPNDEQKRRKAEQSIQSAKRRHQTEQQEGK